MAAYRKFEGKSTQLLEKIRENLERLNEKIDVMIEIQKHGRREIPDNLPVMITSFTEVGFHNSLVIGVEGDRWTIVNYNGYKGDIIAEVDYSSIRFLRRGHSHDEHKFLYPLSQKK